MICNESEEELTILQDYMDGVPGSDRNTRTATTEERKYPDDYNIANNRIIMDNEMMDGGGGEDNNPLGYFRNWLFGVVFNLVYQTCKNLCT